jgi:hypothetical protein
MSSKRTKNLKINRSKQMQASLVGEMEILNLIKLRPNFLKNREGMNKLKNAIPIARVFKTIIVLGKSNFEPINFVNSASNGMQASAAKCETIRIDAIIRRCNLQATCIRPPTTFSSLVSSMC